MAASPRPKKVTPAPQVHIDLERYAPAYINWISNKLSRGASQHYLELFGVGIEVWRLLVELAIKGRTSAQEASRALGMNKASISRAIKSMVEKELIHLSLDPRDGRMRHASLTRKGRALHDRIERLALFREREFLSVLDEAEQALLIDMLHRLHDHLPDVEVRTRQFIQSEGMGAPARKTSALERKAKGAAPTRDNARRSSPNRSAS